MSHVGLSEHDDNPNSDSVSSQCARGKSSTARKPEFHAKKTTKKKQWYFFFKKSNYLDFKSNLDKLNNKIFPHTAQC